MKTEYNCTTATGQANDTASDATGAQTPNGPPIVLMLTNGDSSDEPATVTSEATTPAETEAHHESTPIIATPSEPHALDAVLPDTASTVTPPEPTAPKRRKRGADTKRDDIWTRHHALCLLALICDWIMRGHDPAAKGNPLKGAPGILLDLCRWILNAADYLNCAGSMGLEEQGLKKCYGHWASNRIYYFFRAGSKEHPANRVRANIGTVYREFYDTFSGDVAARTPISEERAKAFWLSVSDRVPFQAPVPERRDSDVQAEVATDLVLLPQPSETAAEAPSIPAH